MKTQDVEKVEKTYFDVLSSIINKNKIDDEDINKHFAGFQAIRWLSIDARSCHSINALNSVRGNKFISKEAEYRFLKNVIVLPRKTFLKAPKDNKDLEPMYTTLMKHFNCNRIQAEEYSNLLGGEALIKILEIYAMLNNSYIQDKDILELRKMLSTKKSEILQIKGI